MDHIYIIYQRNHISINNINIRNLENEKKIKFNSKNRKKKTFATNVKWEIFIFLKVRDSTVKTSIQNFFGEYNFKELNNINNGNNFFTSHVESFFILSNQPIIIYV